LPEDVRERLVDPAALGRFSGWVATRTIEPGELLSRGDLRPPAAPSALRAMSIPSRQPTPLAAHSPPATAST
jgi:hypothetical protein